MTKTPKAFIYCRVSEDRTGSGGSIDDQRKACEDFARENGIEVVEVFEDRSISAFSGKRRKEWDQMLSRIPEVTHILARHVDRLYRGIESYAQLVNLCRDNNVVIYPVQGGEVIDPSKPDGKLRGTLTAGLAEYESDVKRARARGRAERTLSEGRAVSGLRPFGFEIERTEEDKKQKRGGKYVPLKREAEALRDAADEILRGRPMNAIRREWNNPGRPGGPLLNTRGNPWDASGFRRMLVRPRNAGVLLREREEVRDVYPEIIPYERWKRLCKLLEGRKREGHANKAATLGAGVVFCPCGKRVKTWGVSPGRTGERKKVYRCPWDDGAPGPHPSKRVDLVDDLIRFAVWQWYGNPLVFQVGVLTPEEESREAEVMAELQDLDYRRDEANDMFSDGEITREERKRMTDRLSVRRLPLEQELEELRTRTAVASNPFALAAEQGKEQDRRYREWCEWSLDAQRDMLRSTFHILMHSTPKRAGRLFDPNTVEIRLLGPNGEIPGPVPAEVYDEDDETASYQPGQRIGLYVPESAEASLQQRNAYYERTVEHLRDTEAGGEEG